MATGDSVDRPKHVTERRDESLKWMRENYYDSWIEALRDFKCRTKIIKTKDDGGKEVEDESRTNVAMPTPNLIVRRNVARLTANPPTINYRCSDPEVAQKLTAWASFQFDRSGEASEHRRIVHQAELLGWSPAKLVWDTVELYRKFNRGLMNGENVAIRDRKQILESRGMKPEEIDQSRQEAISKYGSDFGDNMSDEEITQQIAQYGPTLQIGERIRKYEGPINRFRFAGDILLEPGVQKLDDSEFVIEQYTETDLWLQKMLKKSFRDPETGEERPVFDEKACSDLISDDSSIRRDDNVDDLRRLFREAQNISDPKLEKRLLGKKRFDILEHHEMRDGQMWIEWIGNEKYKLGEMPYPWDLYGKFVYSELVLLPDLIHNVGDSTVRLLRWLFKLDNVNQGQKIDLINKLLRRTGIVANQTDIPDEVIRRNEGDYLVGKNLRPEAFLDAPNVPTPAFELGADLMRRMAMAEPSITNTDAGTQYSPQAGKTATTAILASKANDVLTQDKVAGLNAFHKEVGTKKLWVLQAEIADMGGMEIPSRYYKDQKALSERYGKVTQITIDPQEIQEDIEVEPEAMSILAVNDELIKKDAVEYYQMAASNPSVFDVRYAAERLATTVPGVDPTKALVPPPDGPPMPETRMNVSLSIKFDDLPAEIQNAMLEKIGMPTSEELQQREQMTAIERVSKAADAAANLEAPANPPEEPNVPGVRNA